MNKLTPFFYAKWLAKYHEENMAGVRKGKRYLKYIKLGENKLGIDAGLSEIDHDCFTVFSSATFWTW